jgi:hypothetical protein
VRKLRTRVARNQIKPWTRSTGSRASPPPSGTTRRSSATSTVRTAYPAFPASHLPPPRGVPAIVGLIRGLLVGLGADMPGMGMEEVEMEMEDDGDMEMEMALELGDATWPEVACPYCYEDHDVASLCVHLEEDHPYEPHAAPCPICSQRVTRDMLNHITMQHGYLFKNGHRSRRYIIPDSHGISLLSRDLRGTHLQALLGGGHSHRSSSSATTNISSDPLLSSFGLSFSTPDAPEPSKSTASIPDSASVRKETPAQPWESRYIVLVIMFSIFFVNCFYICYLNKILLSQIYLLL